MDEENSEELAGLRALALRLLPLFGHNVSSDRRPQLLVGKVPVNLPISLPLPADAHIVGSVQGERRTDIFFDTKEPLEELQRLYAERMVAIGWQNMNESIQRQGRGGFVHYRRTEAVAVAVAPILQVERSAIHQLHEAFFDNDSVTSLTVRATPREEQVVPVQVTLQTYHHPEQAPWRHGFHNIFGILPPLSPPDGSSQHGGGGSAGGTEVWNFATLITDLDVTGIGDHYTAQLLESGWTLLESGYIANDGADGGKRAQWSYWHFTDKENRTWYGSFAVLSHPETPHDYSLVIQARRHADPSGGAVAVAGILSSGIYIGPPTSGG